MIRPLMALLKNNKWAFNILLSVQRIFVIFVKLPLLTCQLIAFYAAARDICFHVLLIFQFLAFFKTVCNLYDMMRIK